MSSSAEQRDYWHCYVLPFIHTPTDNWPPCEQTLLMCSSWLKRRKGDSAWIVSSLWSCCSLKFWTSQSCFFSSNSFIECEYLFINNHWLELSPLYQAHGYLAWVWNCILATCSACSTKILLDSYRIFFKKATFEQVKGIRICWQGSNWQSREKNIGVISYQHYCPSPFCLKIILIYWLIKIFRVNVLTFFLQIKSSTCRWTTTRTK